MSERYSLSKWSKTQCSGCEPLELQAHSIPLPWETKAARLLDTQGGNTEKNGEVIATIVFGGTASCRLF